MQVSYMLSKTHKPVRQFRSYVTFLSVTSPSKLRSMLSLLAWLIILSFLAFKSPTTKRKPVRINYLLCAAQSNFQIYLEFYRLSLIRHCKTGTLSRLQAQKLIFDNFNIDNPIVGNNNLAQWFQNRVWII